MNFNSTIIRILNSKIESLLPIKNFLMLKSNLLYYNLFEKKRFFTSINFYY